MDYQRFINRSFLTQSEGRVNKSLRTRSINRKGFIIYLKNNYLMKRGYTYIMTNEHTTVFYTGVTSDLEKRVFQHKTSFYKGFSSRYRCFKLVRFQEFDSILEAIRKEKYIKGKSRKWKIALIEEHNTNRIDLSNGK